MRRLGHQLAEVTVRSDFCAIDRMPALCDVWAITHVGKWLFTDRPLSIFGLRGTNGTRLAMNLPEHTPCRIIIRACSSQLWGALGADTSNLHADSIALSQISNGFAPGRYHQPVR